MNSSFILCWTTMREWCHRWLSQSCDLYFLRYEPPITRNCNQIACDSAASNYSHVEGSLDLLVINAPPNPHPHTHTYHSHSLLTHPLPYPMCGVTLTARLPAEGFYSSLKALLWEHGCSLRACWPSWMDSMLTRCAEGTNFDWPRSNLM